MNSIIELREVVKVHRVGSSEIRAVDNINLKVEAGEFLSIVGPSGSGKTTLLEVMGCIDNPTSGTILIDGMNVTDLKERELTGLRRDMLGFVFQRSFLLPTLSAVENVMLPSVFSGRPERERAARLLETVGLAGRERHLPSQLSGGEMQRAAIARALVNNPKILLADEPTGNLDSEKAGTVFEIFKRLNREGLTIVIVTHNMELAGMTNRVIPLKDGRMVVGP